MVLDRKLLRKYLVHFKANTRNFGNSCAQTLDSFINPSKYPSRKEKIHNSQSLKSSQPIMQGIQVGNHQIPRYINEYWPAQQRQACSIHEISYRACFKPQLPRFFIELFSDPHQRIYDPFSGRGTTVIEAALLNRNIISNDINPLNLILCKPRLFPPRMPDIRQRLGKIAKKSFQLNDFDLSMFYHPQTLQELLGLQAYLQDRKERQVEDSVDAWIRMVATNRLTGHSIGFFSVYTLPPNQAVSPARQIKINQERNQVPSYRNVKKLILKKSEQLLKTLTLTQKTRLQRRGSQGIFLNRDARFTPEIADGSVQLTITSPPFLDVVQYAQDNWLRAWFNGIDMKQIAPQITMAKTISTWSQVMKEVLAEIYRIIKPNGWVAFEVGEIKKGKIALEDYIVPLGINVGFTCEAILIHQQIFHKTASIWGIESAQKKGTNSNRIILFSKQV